MSAEIFIDTNVFESAKFSYDSENMQNFLEFCNNGSIKLKIVDVVKHEVDKRIKSNISSIIEPIDKEKTGIFASAIGLESSVGKMKIIKTLIDKLKNDFDTFLDENEVEIIESNYDIKELICKYFEQENPFTEQKKHEFPDAIILLTIKNYIQTYPNKTIMTISNDKSFIEFSEENGIHNFNFISGALNYLIQNPNLALKNAFERQLESIKEYIVSKIEDTDFILYSYDSIDLVDVDNTHVKDIVINDLNIVKFDQSENKLYLESNIAIDFSCNAYYPDPDSFHYDKEDGVYYSFTKCISDINLNENIVCILEIFFDEDFNFDILEFELDNNEFEFYLDEAHIVHTKYETGNIDTF